MLAHWAREDMAAKQLEKEKKASRPQAGVGAVCRVGGGWKWGLEESCSARLLAASPGALPARNYLHHRLALSRLPCHVCAESG